jgi:hypothetical protein
MNHDSSTSLRLFEALELRAEYDARITTLKDCLAKGTGRTGRAALFADETGKRRPSPDFDMPAARAALRKLEYKRRKLNSAVQQANFAARVEVDGDQLNLLEALELRKALNGRIAELRDDLVKATYETVIYKEGRDIVEPNNPAYPECEAQLDEARRAFRRLNRQLRRVSFDTPVDFRDE